MKVLLSTNHLLGYTGTETYLFTLSKMLNELGHRITIYSKYQDSIVNETGLNKGIKIVDNLENIKNEQFDIIHTNHNINAIEIRHYFPKTPLIFQSHGVKPFLEQPPVHDININLFLAVSEEVMTNLVKKGVKPTNIAIYRNLIDDEMFFPIQEINNAPKNALIFSNYDSELRDNFLSKICKKNNIKFKFIGGKYGQIRNRDLNNELNKYDLVFTVGRGAMEAMMSGRIPIIINSNEMDTIVTPQNFNNLIKCNLSGRYYKNHFSEKIMQISISKYDSSSTVELIKLVKEKFSAKTNISKLVDIYENTIKNYKPQRFDQDTNDYIFNTINSVQEYDNLIHFKTKEELEIIKKSKAYKIYIKYRHLKNKVYSKLKSND